MASITVATAQALFQSTHPVWGATLESPGNWFLGGNFNPRTPCGVRQEHSSFPCGNTCNFNPRTPCGVRQVDSAKSSGLAEFQSTHPVWGATTDTLSTTLTAVLFQSTHPVWGATLKFSNSHSAERNFNPRTPCGVRPAPAALHTCFAHFNPRTPCGVRPSCGGSISWPGNFNPRTPCGVRPPDHGWCCCALCISIHAPRVGCDTR